MWPYRGLSFRAHRGLVSLKLTADQALVFRLDRGLWSHYFVVIRAKSWSKYEFFFYTTVFHCFWVMGSWISPTLFEIKTEGQSSYIHRKPWCKTRTRNPNSRLSWNSRLNQPGPGGRLLGPAKSNIYYILGCSFLSQVDVNNQNKFTESPESYQRLGGHVLWAGGVGQQLAGGKSKSYFVFSCA